MEFNRYNFNKLLEEKEKVIDSLEQGVLLIESINQKLIDRLYSESISFFNSPLKKRCNLDKEFGGGYADESSQGIYREVLDFNNNYDEDEKEKMRLKEYFPDLYSTLVDVYNEWFVICDTLFPAHGQGFLTLFRYGAKESNEFLLTEHFDTDYVVSFPSIGDPLEIFIDTKWQDNPAKNGEALLMIPGVMHRVSNKCKKERYSITFGYPTFPI